MTINKNILDENGLTSTSANHIANKAKEMYKALEIQLNNLKLVSKKVKLLGTDNYETVEKESSKCFIDAINTNLHTIGELKGLIAYLREAIKYKNALIEKLPIMQDWAISQNYNFEERLKKELPDYKHELIIGTQEYIENMPIEQRSKYLALEAEVATVGQFLHGVFATQMARLAKADSDATSMSGEGANTIITTLTYNIGKDIQNKYLALMDDHRKLQAELNSIKHEIDQEVIKHNTRVTYNKNIYNNFKDTFNSEITREYESYVADTTNKINNLKIIVPQRLKRIYEKVQKA